jgi:hypothetical protein
MNTITRLVQLAVVVTALSGAMFDPARAAEVRSVYSKTLTRICLALPTCPVFFERVAWNKRLEIETISCVIKTVEGNGLTEAVFYVTSTDVLKGVYAVFPQPIWVPPRLGALTNMVSCPFSAGNHRTSK